MPHKRSSGILMHITSLPSAHGVGTMGVVARQFIDQMVEMGQSIWQILPINPPNGLGCPYSASSTFANFELLVSFNDLVKDGLLDKTDLENLDQLSDEIMDYDKIVTVRTPVLRKACQNFLNGSKPEWLSDFAQYCKKHDSVWLDDYALYAVLKEKYNKSWTDWPKALARFDTQAIQEARDAHIEKILLIKAGQFLFEHYWQDLRKYANERGIEIFGDVPIYVAQDSADVWSSQADFLLDRETGEPTHIAGCPPDNFCHEGQRWGNPIYNWDAMEKDKFGWWKHRIARAVELMDFVRVDHFRAFAAYWSIPASCPTAIDGEWIKAPGHALFNALRDEFGQDLPLIAEDLGHITPDVIDLRDSFDIFGMKVLNFLSEEGDFQGDRHPRHYPKGSVCYIGTHDNDTGLGWLNKDCDPGKTEEESQRYRNWFRAIMDTKILEAYGQHWAMIDVAVKSNSNMVIFQMQDLLGQGTEGRMNIPGTAEGQWQWRLQKDALTDQIRQTMRNFTEQSKRLPT
ncbi:4-alpha-glucanotransferase [Temperatibacter marinus]|uniref:4-alpha-glucanotransferase n=1 Tax=Temperatibacter marinus TaxID=1456591 RepID=A0AA52EE89_9PROT|nr:4-alpha-glucanotransferase [Temperatibacter marinus]WND01473.1 4-alpha-glucanotransferase [Temperatibacter marinus]